MKLLLLVVFLGVSLALIGLLVVYFLLWPCGVVFMLLSLAVAALHPFLVTFQASLCGFCLKLSCLRSFPLKFQLLFESSPRVFVLLSSGFVVIVLSWPFFGSYFV